MKCFYHNNNSAIGLCLYCGRALCSKCVISFDKGLSCSVSCENKVKEKLVKQEEQLVNKRIALKVKINAIKNSVNILPKVSQWLLAGLFISLFAGIYFAHIYIKITIDRQVTEYGLLGTIISFGIPVYLYYRKKAGR